MGNTATLDGSAETVSRTRAIYGAWNIVELEVDGSLYRLEEISTGALAALAHRVGPSSRIILPVHQQISFYRDKDNIVMLDTRGKKHRFQIVGVVVQPAN